jgi:AcrR family transcriptional regulator
MSTGASEEAPEAGRASRPPRVSLRTEQIAGTRAAIVSSARRLFGSRGYAATSIDEVAAAARVTKGAVYHHFGSKEALFRAVYDEVEAEAQRIDEGDLPREAGPVELILYGVQHYLDAALDPEVQRITLIDAPAVLGPEPDGPADEHPGHQALRALIAGAVEAGTIRSVDPDALAHLISGACLQAGVLIARADDHAAARRRVGATLDVMITGLAAGRPPPDWARPAER